MLGSRHTAALIVAIVLGVATTAGSCRNPEGPSAWTPEPPIPGTLPFGPKEVPDTLFARPFSGGYRVLSTDSYLRETLDAARAARVRLIVRPVGGLTRYQNADGTFSLEKWKHELDAVRDFNFRPYVEDGTVLGIELVNEPHVPEKWGGRVISREELDEAARYAKSFWPYLPVGAGRTDYLLGRAPWPHLDFGHSQYHMRKGDVSAWLATTVNEARAAGVGLVLSLNFLGGEVGDLPMTAEEVRHYGQVLAADTHACLLTGYVYDSSYFSWPGMADAFRAIGLVARSHTSPPCYAGTIK